jgi:flagellar basal-body rod modification protein FlgD
MDLSILTNAASKAPTPVRNEGDSSVSESYSAVAEQFDTFLNLLTAQIKNQDPLAPMDSTQFVEQLATFSNLELQAKNTQILEDIAGLLTLQLATSSTQDS